MVDNSTRESALVPQSSIPLRSPFRISYRGKTIAQACAEGNVPLTAMLIAEGVDAGIDMTLPDEDECTLLHYAALGANVDLVEYVLKKSKDRDIDERNNAGETALLRCAIQGNVAVSWLLLQKGAKLLAVDKKKNTVFHNAARNGCLWLFVFLVHQLIQEMPPLGEEERGGFTDILSREDDNGHTPMDWACYHGHLHVIRYLLRLGQDPSRRDATGRSCLHWAALRGREDVCYYLSRLDMPASTWAPDVDGISPQQYLHRHQKHLFWQEAIVLLPRQQPHHSKKNCRQRRNGEDSSNEDEEEAVTAMEYENGSSGIPNPTCTVFHDYQESLIWQKHNHRTQVLVVAFYSLLFFGLWALSFVVPSWAWFIIVAFVISMLVWITRYVTSGADRPIKAGKMLRCFLSPFVIDLCLAREKFLSISLGVMFCFIAYTVLLGLRLSGTTVADGDDDFPGHSLSQGWTNVVIWLEVGLLVGLIISWLLLNFVFFDPGRAELSRADFIYMSKEVVNAHGPPDVSKFCHTCLVHRPLRSKHCSICGICVARMDHHCIWLNSCIGALNHRSFILFLVFHALSSIVWSVLSIYAWSREIPNASNPGGSDACQAVEDIFSTKYLPTLILGILAMWSSIFVVVTLCDQLRNVALNISINERVNWKRYIWLRTPVNGKFFNWYDRGFWCNCMEFWKLDERGRCRDFYFRNFSLPALSTVQQGQMNKIEQLAYPPSSSQ